MTASHRADVGGAHDLWHYAVGSERKGPVPRTTIAKLLASGEISAETYVWQPGMDNWVHLGDAPPLKPLVAGLEGDGNPEEFVEEDTAFTSPADLKAVHNELDSDDEELSGDTIVESIPTPGTGMSAGGSSGPKGTVRSAKAKGTGKMPVVKPVEPAPAPKPANTTLIATPGAMMGASAFAPVVAATPAPAPAAELQSHPQPQPQKDSGLLGAPVAVTGLEVASSTSGASSASGSDIFAIGKGLGDDDLFGGSAPTSEAEDIAGVHGRRQSSVLFSLDELGREEGKKTGKGGNEQFVTDSSGLIDIKAIATSEKRGGGDDPFGSSAPNLVLAPRGGPAAMTIPIVERKRGNGPWILAAAGLVLIGGVIVALILSSGPDPVSQPPLAANDPTRTEPAKDPAGVVAKPATEAKIDPADPVVKPTEAKVDPALANPADPAKPVDPAKPADPATNPTTPPTEVKDPVAALTETKPATTALVEKKPVEDKKPVERKPVEDKKPVEKKPVEDKPKEPVVVAAPHTNPGNTEKVNDLLSKLNKGDKTEDKTPAPSDSSLPDKLSAATVRNTIKGRFGRCGGMISNPNGSVTVQTQFVISSSGVVQSARVSDGGGTSPDVQRCVVSVIKETSFAKFKESTMQVNLPVRLL